MSKSRAKAAIAVLLMICAVVSATLWHPHIRLADHLAKVDLEAFFPKAFGNWTLDTSGPVQLISPDTQALLDQIYNQLLNRTYVNRATGERMMLSVAYGGDQSDATRAHRPEVCYPAQGFEVLSNGSAVFKTASHPVHVRQLVTRMGGRVEPVSYWVITGNRVALSGTEQKLAQLHYGFRGIVADGMLVRVSNISADSAKAYAAQADFVFTLTQAMSKDALARVIGVPAEI